MPCQTAFFDNLRPSARLISLMASDGLVPNKTASIATPMRRPGFPDGFSGSGGD
jgi:hypothetical protein